jgi:HSP20 family protein
MFLTELDQRIWDPLEAVSQIRDEMSRLFRERAGAEAYPPLNIWTGEHQAVVTAELPGVDPKDLDISVEENVLSLSGSRKWDDPREDAVIHRVECPNGGFRRALELPFRVDANRIQASYSKGILTVALPRAEQDKPTKIQVKAA